MSTGAFRDAGAALERVRLLEEEIDRLKAENASLSGRLDTLLAGLDTHKLSAELRKALQERDLARREKEEANAAQITRFQEMKAERKALESSHREEIAALEARLDPTTKAREHEFAREDASRLAQRLAQAIAERDAFALRLATGLDSEESNLSAFLKRVIEERDEVVRELQAVRESSASRKTRGSGVLGRTLGRLFGEGS